MNVLVAQAPLSLIRCIRYQAESIMQDENGVWTACCIKGCDDVPVSNGMCVNHHRRNVKYGSPVAHKIATWMWRRYTDEERFWFQVSKADDCWLWRQGRDQDGYGVFVAKHNGVSFTRAHRYSFALHTGQTIPNGMHICHTCDTPSCVRPDHLFLGTPKENQQDKWAKGRANLAFGENHREAILTEDQAKAILNDPRPHSQIANEYGIHPQTVSSLKTRVSWQHLGKERGVKAKRVSPRKGVSDKITPDIVRTIRTSTEAGKDLAARYGISPQTITDIRKRRSWAHVE